MVAPRHLIDEAAHEERFAALKAEMEGKIGEAVAGVTVPAASTTQAGTVVLGTSTEAIAGVHTTKVVTVKALADVLAQNEGKLFTRSVTFTASGTWTAPEDCVVFIVAVGGGGGGGGAGGGNALCPGGRGGTHTSTGVSYLPKGTIVSITIGAGGTGGAGGWATSTSNYWYGGSGGSIGGKTSVKFLGTSVETSQGGGGGGGKSPGSTSTTPYGSNGYGPGGGAGQTTSGVAGGDAYSSTDNRGGNGGSAIAAAGKPGMSGEVIIYY